MFKPNKDLYEFGEFRLNVNERLLLRAGERVPLAEKAFETLCALVKHGNHLVSKEELLAEVWADAVVETNNLDKNISYLRKILGEKKDEVKFIETVRGHGYRFVAEVREVAEEEKDAEEREHGKAGTETLNSRFEVSSQTGNELAPPAPTSVFPSEPQISDDGSQIEKQTGIPEVKVNKNQVQHPQSKIQDRRRLIASIALSILVLGPLGFYLWPGNTKPADAPIKSIAVLPFKPLVAESRDEALEIGMADTLISRLGSGREIIVRPLSSVRKYGNLEQDAQTAGRELGAEAVLDGNIQRWGNKIRVNVRLVKVADGTLLWTGTFDENFTDIFVVQDAISIKVASALALRLSGSEQARLEKRYTNSAEAYEFYLRGRFHFFKITPPEVRRAIGFYRQAIEADPNYALALAGMADAYRTQAIAAHAPSKEVCPQAKALAMRALEIDASLADAYVVLGWIGFLYDLDWENAERQLKRAIELAPNNSEAHRAYAHLLSSAGRHDEALAESKIARELAPLTLITAALEGQILFYAGRYDEAIARLDKTLELDSNFWAAYTYLGRVYILQGRFDEAVAVLTRAREISGGSNEPITQIGYALAKSGNRERAQATLEELKSLAKENYVPAYSFAIIYNGLGEREEALNYLEKSFEEREVQLTFIKIDTRWDNLRNERRFIKIIKWMKLQQ